MADGASSSGAGAGAGESVVIDYGRRRTTCGYCRSNGPTSISHALLDNGWRRSGCFLYKPEMERTCCPSYTIRLKASDFISSKEQGRALKKMQRYLDGELDPPVGTPQGMISAAKRSLNEHVNSNISKVSKVSDNEYHGVTCPSLCKDDSISCLSNKINEAIDMCFQGGIFGSNVQFPKAVVKTIKPQVRKKVTCSTRKGSRGSSARFGAHARPLLLLLKLSAHLQIANLLYSTCMESYLFCT